MVPDPFDAPVGSVVHLVDPGLLPDPRRLPTLFRVRVTGPLEGVDEVWVPGRRRWEATSGLVPHRAGRADSDVEVVSAADALRLVEAHALALERSGPEGPPLLG